MKSISLVVGVAALCLIGSAASASTLVSSTTNLPADMFSAPTSQTGGTYVGVTGSVGGQYASPFGDNTSPYNAVQGGSATYNLAGNTLSLVFGSPDDYNTISFLNAAGVAFDSFTPGTGAGASLDRGSSYFLTIRADSNFSAVQFSSNGAALEFSNVAVSSVPLPASAPMFGAALLALAGLGYGVQRKKVATTA